MLTRLDQMSRSTSSDIELFMNLRSIGTTHSQRGSADSDSRVFHGQVEAVTFHSHVWGHLVPRSSLMNHSDDSEVTKIRNKNAGMKQFVIFLPQDHREQWQT